ncbi:hypothetical protein V1460_04595 [Streptomyces sp. SCSIO 30461]|uniref:hypothetical protein n=1 Tax=Streptomyces sp. SCSIO 30461 TaxID=3118085 RepID=UPI0030CCDD13
MSDITGSRIVHEAYAFACMRCGYGWEQAYEIEHHTDASGNDFIIYTADGIHVPSPLNRPTCRNCEGHTVRIMRAGKVSSVVDPMNEHYHYPVAPGIAGPLPAVYASSGSPARQAAEPAAARPAGSAREPRPVKRRRLAALFRSSRRTEADK